MVHHRIQKKKRNKLKPVDPFNKASTAICEKMKHKNLEPAKDDDQPPSRRLLEIKAISGRVDAALRPAKQKRHKNRVVEEAMKAGFEIRKGDDTNHLLSRIGKITHRDVQEKLMMAKHEIAGCDIRHLEENNILGKKKRSKITMNSNPPSQISKEGPAEKLTFKSRRTFHDVSTNVGDCSEQKRKKLSRKQRQSIRKREHQENERKELLLNAKEYVPFGSQYNAPPQFSGVVRQELGHHSVKAGKKSLLMKSILQEKKCSENSSQIGKNDSGEANNRSRREKLKRERLRIIEAYRKFKKAD